MLSSLLGGRRQWSEKQQIQEGQETVGPSPSSNMCSLDTCSRRAAGGLEDKQKHDLPPMNYSDSSFTEQLMEKDSWV